MQRERDSTRVFAVINTLSLSLSLSINTHLKNIYIYIYLHHKGKSPQFGRVKNEGFGAVSYPSKSPQTCSPLHLKTTKNHPILFFLLFSPILHPNSLLSTFYFVCVCVCVYTQLLQIRMCLHPSFCPCKSQIQGVNNFFFGAKHKEQ